MPRQALTVLTFTLLFAGTMRADDGPNRDKNADGNQPLVTQDGEWEEQSYIANGIRLEDMKCLYSFKGDSLTVSEGRTTVKFVLKIDAKSEPKTMDMRADGRSLTVLGIYDVKDDILTICQGGEKDRPTEFSSPKGSFQVLITLKRIKK